MHLRWLPVAAFAVLTTVTSCKKETTSDNTDNSTTELTTHTDDQMISRTFRWNLMRL
jgi:hypothetical protein